MPRPVKENPRDCFMSFRFTEVEITRLHARARASGQTPSAYVRGRLFDTWEGDAEPPAGGELGLGDRGQPSGTADPAPPRTRPINQSALRLLIDQLRRVGTNLNQIAHRMNELRIPPPRDLVMVLDEIRAYVRQARDL